MTMAEQLSENSRQGFEAENPPCIGLESDLSRNLRWGCGHVYDETPVGLAVYVRNDPVNRIDPDGRQDFGPVSELQLLQQMGWGTTSDILSFLSSLPGVSFNSAYFRYSMFNTWESNENLLAAVAVTLQYANQGVSTGSSGGSGGSADPLAEKKQYYNDVVGKNYANVADRIQGKCAAFIDAMQRKLFISYSYMDPATFVISGLQSATKNYAATGPGFTSGFGRGGWTVARTTGNTINLGERFYSNNLNPILTLIHEFFHLESTSGSRNKNLDHVDLLNIAQSAGYTTTNRNADQAWKSLLNDQCGK